MRLAVLAVWLVVTTASVGASAASCGDLNDSGGPDPGDATLAGAFAPGSGSGGNWLRQGSGWISFEVNGSSSRSPEADDDRA
jgi:hypothetical protein